MKVQERRYTVPPENHDATMVFLQGALGTDEFDLGIHDSKGYKSTTYSCDTPTGSYILRHGYDRRGMAKDRYAAEHFNRDDLPVPSIVGIQELPDKSVLCLSERAQGSTLDEIELGQAGTSLNTDFVATLEAIHRTDVSDTRGYGLAKSNGQGALTRRLFEAGVQRRALSLYFGRSAEKNTDIGARDFKEVVALQHALAGSRISERRLCHGDLKGSNLLASQHRITGVIDWSRFEYGDPALDLGMLHVRYPGAVDIDKHAESIGLSQRDLQRRVFSYALGECVISMGFFGQQGNESQFKEAESRLLEIAHEAQSASTAIALPRNASQISTAPALVFTPELSQVVSG